MPESKRVGIQRPDFVGDTVWMTWCANAIVNTGSQPNLHSPLAEPLCNLVHPEVVNTSTPQPEEFDLSIGFPNDTGVLPRGLRRLGLPQVQCHRSYIVEKACDTRHFKETGEVHVMDALAARLKEIWPSLELPARALFPEFCVALDPLPKMDLPLVSINILASKAEKLYPLERWIEVINHLRKEGVQVVCLGGNVPHHSWQEICARHLRQDSGLPVFVDLVGRADLMQLAAVIGISDLHIATDTGSGHLAAAKGVATISLFGKFTIAEVCRPYGDKALVIESDDWTPESINPASVAKLALKALTKK